jgi:hypothetical protein
MSGATIDPALLANLNAGVTAAGGDIPDLGVTGDLKGGNPFAAYFPTYAGGTDTSGASSGDLAKTLAGLGKISGGGASSGGAPPAAAAPGMGQAGSPRRPVNLEQLIQLLRQRQEGLLNSATGVGQQAGQPLPSPRTTGLLGF